MFELHPRLREDTLPLGRLGLCRLLLMDDANFPWLVLVPEREGLVEIHDLGDEDQIRALQDVCLVSRALKRELGAHKINVAALGNVVPQLHIHVVARFRTDPAWPDPVWGKVPKRRYLPPEAEEMRGRVAKALRGA